MIFVPTVHHLEPRCDLPVELPNELVELERSRKLSLGSRLRVLISDVPVAGEIPHPICQAGTSEMSGNVSVACALKPRLLVGTVAGNLDRLAGKTTRLEMERGVETMAISPLLDHNIEYPTLEPSVLR